MYVVGDNLKALVQQHRIVDYEGAFDHSSLTLRIDGSLKELSTPNDNRIVLYGEDLDDGYVKEKRIPSHGFILEPKSGVLACSVEKISIPKGFIGFVHTKGSLARLMVTVHCCDPQVDPGYSGKITFEIVNLGSLRIKIREGQPVAQLFIAKTSTKEVQSYSGRYQGATGPTHFVKRPSE